MDKVLLRVDEAASAIGCSRSKTYELINQGELPSIRLGHSIRVPVEALRQLINERAAVTANDDGAEKETGRDRLRSR